MYFSTTPNSAAVAHCVRSKESLLVLKFEIGPEIIVNNVMTLFTIIPVGNFFFVQIFKNSIVPHCFAFCNILI